MRLSWALLRQVLVWSAIAAAVYFGNVRVQTWLGQRALAETGLAVHSLDEGLRRAATEDRLVLADVSAIWCSSCRSFDRKVLADPQVRDLIDERFVFVRLEYESDEGRAFSERHGISGFPRLVVLDATGRLVARLPTVYDPSVFRHSLEGVRSTMNADHLHDELQSIEDLDAAFARSEDHPVLLFKHSNTCPVSARAHAQYRAFVEEHGPDAAMIVVQEARPLSEAVAERTGVRHESPQALLLSGGEAVWHASHGAITAEALARELDRVAD